MKIKLYSIVLLLFLSVSPLFAQLELGVSAGLTHNSLTTSSGYFYTRDYNSKQGYAVSALVKYAINDWFALQGEMGYMQKNYSSERAEQSEFENVSNGYFQLPVMCNFSFGGEKLRGFLNLGMYVGAWTDSNIEGRLIDDEDYNEAYSFDDRRDNRFDAGLIAGIGLEYQGSARVRYFVEARMLYGLTDLQKQYMLNMIPRYNTTLSFQVGATYCF